MMAGLELAPELAGTSREARVDFVASISAAQDPGFIARARARVAGPVGVDERDPRPGVGEVVRRPRAERSGANHDNVRQGRGDGRHYYAAARSAAAGTRTINAPIASATITAA